MQTRLLVRPLAQSMVVQVALVASLSAQTPRPPSPAAAQAIAAARAGGVSIVCRHAITDHARDDADRVDYADVRTQRLLSPEGERQSAEMGRALRALGVPVRELVASPMQRARRTAELMNLGPVTIDTVWHTNDGDYGGPRRDARRRVVRTPPARGTRLIVSHIVTLASAVPEADGKLDEGDCIVVRPAGGRHQVVGVVPWKAWGQAAASSGRRR